MSNPWIHGYGIETRFKKGQSGNPKGRPKGSKNLATIARKILFDEKLFAKMIKKPPSYWDYVEDKHFASMIIVAIAVNAAHGHVPSASLLFKIVGNSNPREADEEQEMRPMQVIDMRTGKPLSDTEAEKATNKAARRSKVPSTLRSKVAKNVQKKTSKN